MKIPEAKIDKISATWTLSMVSLEFLILNLRQILGDNPRLSQFCKVFQQSFELIKYRVDSPGFKYFQLEHGSVKTCRTSKYLFQVSPQIVDEAHKLEKWQKAFWPRVIRIEIHFTIWVQWYCPFMRPRHQVHPCSIDVWGSPPHTIFTFEEKIHSWIGLILLWYKSC